MKRRISKAKKRNNKAKVATCSDSGSNESEGEQQEMGNHYLIAKGDPEEQEGENSKEITLTLSYFHKI